MFEARLLALRQRQLALRLRQAELRTALAADAARLRPALAAADLGRSAWWRWRSWTLAPAGRWSALGLALLAGLGARSARQRWRRWLPWLRLGRTAYGLWQAWRAGPAEAANGARSKRDRPAGSSPEGRHAPGSTRVP